MRFIPRDCISLGWLIGIGSVWGAGAAVGQTRSGFKAPTTTLVGRVIDSADTPIADAEVVVLRQKDSAQIKAGKSNKKGIVILRDLPAGGPYTVTARKIGYGPAQGQLQFRGGDTLHIDFELPPFAATLAPIVVTARRSRSSIAAGEFNPKLYRDALNLIVDQRRDMLGDPERCPLPDTTFGGPGNDGVSRVRVTDRFTLFGGDSEKLRALRKRPWIDSLKYHSFKDPELPYVQRLYVNGQRVDWPKVRGQPVPGRTVIDELRRIPADQIAEIRYADCWDQSVPYHMQYALYVVLKPPSQDVQDSILRSVTRQPKDS